MTLLLVRHSEIARRWHGRCYGASDAGLSLAGRAAIAAIVEQLAAHPIARVIHSDMARTRALALPLARRLGVPLIADPRWRERDFGDWEGRSWAEIHRRTGSAMDGMIDAPASFRPGGGETTVELGDRVLAAWRAAAGVGGTTAIITHGGPIGALVGSLAGAAPAEWHRHVPPYGAIVRLGKG